MTAGYILLLCCIGTALPQDLNRTTSEPYQEVIAPKHNEEDIKEYKLYVNEPMDDLTFYSIVGGTSVCLILLLWLCGVFACLKMRYDMEKSVAFNIQQVMMATHSMSSCDKLRAQPTFVRNTGYTYNARINAKINSGIRRYSLRKQASFGRNNNQQIRSSIGKYSLKSV